MLTEGHHKQRTEQTDAFFAKLAWCDWSGKKNEEENSKSRKFLSGGELQKICLCRAFLWDPEFLIMDEPFNNLDPDSRRGLLEFVMGGNDSTRVLILHDIYLALDICSHIFS